MEELREKLKKFISYDEGEVLRKKIRDYYIKNYKQKYSDREHMDFIKRNPSITIRVNHPQGTNFPYYYTMFSIVAQHQRGDTIEELFDKSINIELTN